MSIYAIGDLHFGHANNKTMDIFGASWENHVAKIKAHWAQTIQEEDLVLLVGDLSWGMSEAEGDADLEQIRRLAGRKLLLEGNHDFWWKSTSKLERKYPEFLFLKNNAHAFENWVICGSRGWTCPNEKKFDAQDEKLYQREQMRMRLSLEHAMRLGATDLILAMHFPPTNEKREHSGFLELIAQYPVRHVVYGHLHDAQSHQTALQGLHDGVEYHLVSADYLQFTPKKIV